MGIHGIDLTFSLNLLILRGIKSVKLGTKLIKNSFSIKDLENLSEVKAHTIRIWEQRYSALTPERSEGNQRIYSIESLKRLLNLAYLIESGYKISKIAELSKLDLESLVNQKITSDKSVYYLNDQLKVAILSFDEETIDKTIDQVVGKLGLEIGYTEVIFPLLKKVGVLWQSSQITPAHEHFIVNIVKQKLIFGSAQVPKNSKTDGPVFVLFLPDHELHEIGLLYVNLYLRIRGAKTIYLGQSTPIEDLKLFSELEGVIFVSSFTIYANIGNYSKFLNEIHEKIARIQKAKLWFHCREDVNFEVKPTNISQYKTQEDLKALVDAVL